jgi:transcriptional regulator with XRE-family HTH domain
MGAIDNGLKKDIGKRIKLVRREKGLTQDEMVKHLHCGRSNYSKIESGQIMPGGMLLAALHYKLNVSLDWLFSGQGTRYYESPFPDFGDYQSDVRELLTDMVQYKAVKHSILSHYYSYRIKYKMALERLDNEKEQKNDP